MKLVCPACGAVASADAWLNDADARQVLRLVVDLPDAVRRKTFAYLALFRPANGKGLRWSTALKLLGELAALVRESFVSWDGKPARKNNAIAWGQAMERMVEHPPRKLPLKSHGYLRSVAYEIADEIDRSDETRRNAAEASGGKGLRKIAPEGFRRIDADEMRRIRELKGV